MRTRVLLVGAGGLGCPAALALAAGREPDAPAFSLTIVDDDAVEVSNLHRQILHRADRVGAGKAASLAEAARALGGGRIAVTDRRERVTAAGAAALLAEHDLVLDASDNYPTRFLLNDAAVLAGKPLVHAAAVGLRGQLLTVPAGGRPCYRCLFEELPQQGTGASCAEAGVLGPVPGVMGALQGGEAARILAGGKATFIGRLIQYDSASMSFRSVTFRANPACAVCGPRPRIGALRPAEYDARRPEECPTP